MGIWAGAQANASLLDRAFFLTQQLVDGKAGDHYGPTGGGSRIGRRKDMMEQIKI